MDVLIRCFGPCSGGSDEPAKVLEEGSDVFLCFGKIPDSEWRMVGWGEAGSRLVWMREDEMSCGLRALATFTLLQTIFHIAGCFSFENVLISSIFCFKFHCIRKKPLNSHRAHDGLHSLVLADLCSLVAPLLSILWFHWTAFSSMNAHPPSCHRAFVHSVPSAWDFLLSCVT